MSRWGTMDGVADLPERAFSENKFTRTYEGGGGGGQTTSTSYQTNLPEYAQPFYEEMMTRAQGESLRPYTPYTGDRTAAPSSLQTGVRSEVAGMGTPSAMGDASRLFGTAESALAGNMNYTPTSFGSAAYSPTGTTSGYSASPITSSYKAGTFDAATANKMMDPYMQAVVNEQKKQIQQDYNKSKAGRAAQAVQAGAFGGSRQGVQEAVAESEMLDRMAMAQATGMQSAYDQARQQFAAEQAMQQQESSQGMTAQQQSELARQQQEQFQQSAAQMTQQDAQFAAQHAKDILSSEEASKQFAAQYGQQGVQLAQQLGAAQQGLAVAQQGLDESRLKLQNAVGAEEKAEAQRELDLKYEEFINARDNERQNLAFYNALLRGIPVPVQSQAVQYQPQGNTGAQILGAGLTGLAGFGGLS